MEVCYLVSIVCEYTYNNYGYVACIGGMYKSHKYHDNNRNNVHKFMHAAEDEISVN